MLFFNNGKVRNNELFIFSYLLNFYLLGYFKIHLPLTLQLTMRKFKIERPYIMRVIGIFLVSSGTAILMELYVPIKRILLGEKLIYNDFLNYLDISRYLPILLIGSVVLGFLLKNDRNELVEK